MGRLFAIEIIYRGIFQKTMAGRISRAIVLAAHHEGKPGISFGRYGDSPERNGIPAKNFAIVATDEETLQDGMAKYEPKEVDVTICVDDTLCKGVESWAWYGLQPVNRLLKPGGTLSRWRTARNIRTNCRFLRARSVFQAYGCTRTITPMCASWARLPKCCLICSA
jgi:pyruvate ferredoxin oxidoreductase delta subunit